MLFGKNIGKFIENLKVKLEKMFYKRQFAVDKYIKIKKMDHSQ